VHINTVAVVWFVIEREHAMQSFCWLLEPDCPPDARGRSVTAGGESSGDRRWFASRCGDRHVDTVRVLFQIDDRMLHTKVGASLLGAVCEPFV